MTVSSTQAISQLRTIGTVFLTDNEQKKLLYRNNSIVRVLKINESKGGRIQLVAIGTAILITENWFENW